MKRIFTLLLLVLAFTANVSAQFTEADVKFWIGEGPDTAVLVVDFRDGTSDSSFAWGYRYDEADGLTFLDMLNAVAAAEPQFTIAQSGGFLEDVVYNSHSQLAGEPDWWSTWSGSSLEEMGGNGGVSEELLDGRWYGLSYGFMGEGDPHAPTVTYPAYSSLWFTQNEIEYWVGEGENKSVIIIDFNTDSETPVTYAWGVRYNGLITAQAAFDLIAEADANLDITVVGGEITAVTYNDLSATTTGNITWQGFKGTNMSNWILNNDLSTTLGNGVWFGVSYGGAEARRPFIPTPAEEEPTAGLTDVTANKFTVYPNPVTSLLNINSDAAIQKVELITSMGQNIKTFVNVSSQIDLSDISAGIYFVKIYSENGAFIQKIIKG